MHGRFVPGHDVFHGLNQRLPKGRLRKAVCTFHDLFVLTGEYSTPEFRARFAEQARAAAGRADVIICVSAFTALQVETLLHVPRDRLRVVHHGVHPPEPQYILPRSAREPILLFVGAIQKRKNVLRLVEAFERIPAPWRLMIAGSAGYGGEELMGRIANSPAADRIHVLGYVSPENLRQLYRTATAFVFPSLDEGFGIPVLEAMAWGTPVVTSSVSALPEVAGGAATLVDPLAAEEIAWAMRRLLEDEGEWERQSVAGRRRAAELPWSKAAAETWSVYQSL
jgi:glycosyltransferase involved in cell wall biosynthesis